VWQNRYLGDEIRWEAMPSGCTHDSSDKDAREGGVGGRPWTRGQGRGGGTATGLELVVTVLVGILLRNGSNIFDKTADTRRSLEGKSGRLLTGARSQNRSVRDPTATERASKLGRE